MGFVVEAAGDGECGVSNSKSAAAAVESTRLSNGENAVGAPNASLPAHSLKHR